MVSKIIKTCQSDLKSLLNLFIRQDESITVRIRTSSLVKREAAFSFMCVHPPSTPAQPQEIVSFKLILSPKSNIHWQTFMPKCLKKEMFNGLGKLNFKKKRKKKERRGGGTETKAVFVPALSPAFPYCCFSFARWMEHACSAISQLATDEEVKWYRQHYPEINQREPDTARQVDENKRK